MEPERAASSGAPAECAGRLFSVKLHCEHMAQHPKSVLWIDDEADLLESHRIFLREKGFEVESATNADDAVEMLRRRAYGIVLLDEQMPGKRGLEAYPR